MKRMARFSILSLSQTGPPHSPCPGHLQGLRLLPLPEAVEDKPVECGTLQILPKVDMLAHRCVEQDPKAAASGRAVLVT